MSHDACQQWTIGITENGIETYITKIVFESDAVSAARGISQDNPDALIRVYFAGETKVKTRRYLFRKGKKVNS